MHTVSLASACILAFVSLAATSVAAAADAPAKTACTASGEGARKAQNDIHKTIDQVLAPVQATRVYFTDWTVQPDAK